MLRQNFREIPVEGKDKKEKLAAVHYELTIASAKKKLLTISTN